MCIYAFMYLKSNGLCFVKISYLQILVSESSSVFSGNGLIKDGTSPCSLCLAFILRPCQLWQKNATFVFKTETKNGKLYVIQNNENVTVSLPF